MSGVRRILKPKDCEKILQSFRVSVFQSFSVSTFQGFQ